MQIIKKNHFPMDVVQATNTDGRVFASVILKATYDFPDQDDRVPRMARKQLPILPADLFEGEPGVTTPYFESDYVFRKQRCDVVLKATAHALGGRPVAELVAGFRVGSCVKQVRVIGNRIWKRPWMGGLKPTPPEPFLSMPITYSRAFGGNWLQEEREDRAECFDANPIGQGWAKHSWNQRRLEGRPVPNLEPLEQRITRPDRRVEPCSFGPIGRSWEPRRAFAGTYDDHWKETIFPLLPRDFDERFFQCVPTDQQIDFPKGGEIVELWNLHPLRPHIRFPLPKYRLPLMIVLESGEHHDLEMRIDGVLIDADAGKVSLVWRALQPIKRSLKEVTGIGVGRLGTGCRQALQMGGECACACPTEPEKRVEKVLEESSTETIQEEVFA